MKKLSTLFALGAVCTALTVASCTNFTQPQSDAITGKVVDDYSDNPIVGAIVIFGNDSTYTDGAGAFRFEGGNGGHTLTAWALGHDTYSTDVYEAPKDLGTIHLNAHAPFIAYYPLNGNANDSMPNAYNGTAVGTAAAKDRFGRSGYAMSFPSTTSKITVPSSPDLNLSSSSFSLTAWVLIPATSSGTFPIFSKSNGSTFNYLGYDFSVYSTGSQMYPQAKFGSQNGTASSYGPSTATGAWHLLALVADHGGNIEWYIDGQAVKDDYILALNQGIGTTVPLQIGGGSTGGSMTLDDVRIFGGALTPYDINYLYHETAH